MSLYDQLKRNPPKLQVAGEVREIKINLVSVMCDNKYRWTARKNNEGDFKVFTDRFAYSNFGIPTTKTTLNGLWTTAIGIGCSI